MSGGTGDPPTPSISQVTAVKVLSAALAVIRVHVLPLVPVTRPQANVCRTTTNIQTAVDIIKCGARPKYRLHSKHSTIVLINTLANNKEWIHQKKQQSTCSENSV